MNSTRNGVSSLSMVKDSLFNKETRWSEVLVDNAWALVINNRRRVGIENSVETVNLEAIVNVIVVGEKVKLATAYQATSRRELFTMYI